ncbi:MAG TPA: hypothetical protein VFZ34_00550 [Blastocatellia bacterium]|nr:hypothetical protein [Blastocatellia bacterium]
MEVFPETATLVPGALLLVQAVAKNAAVNVVSGLKQRGQDKKLRQLWGAGRYRSAFIDWAWEQLRLHLTPILRPQKRNGFVWFLRRSRGGTDVR